MPEPQPSAGDTFHIIGFTREDILNGALMRSLQLSTENLKMMGALAQRLGPLSQAVERGLVVKRMIEVYFLDPFVAHDTEDFEQKYGKYQVVDYYNETALKLSGQFGIQLPPVIGKITRAELPDAIGISMKGMCFTPRDT